MESIPPTQVFQDLDTPVSTLDNIIHPSLVMTAEEEIIFNASEKGTWKANGTFLHSVFPEYAVIRQLRCCHNCVQEGTLNLGKTSDRATHKEPSLAIAEEQKEGRCEKQVHMAGCQKDKGEAHSAYFPHH